MSNLRYSIWSLWPALPIVLKLYFLLFVVVSAYIIVTSILVVARLRAVTRKAGTQDNTESKAMLARLRARRTNTTQLLTATSYLFGLAFFIALPAATFVSVLSSRPTGYYILENFVYDFIFAANVFFVLFVLHLLLWLVSNSLRATTE
jgi:hypothetical protein